VTKHHGLTALAVENAKPSNTRREISDGRGLFLVVQPSGGKSWAYRYRFAGKPVKLTLGSSPQVSLGAARKLAAEARHKVEQGTDPGAEKVAARRAEKAAAADHEADTVERLVAQFIEQHAKRKTRSWRATERILQRNVLPAWRGCSVHDITKRNVIDLVEAIAADHPITANRTLAHTRKFFNWLVDRDVLPNSPCRSVKAPGPEKARERTLSDSEIAQFWHAADDTEPMGAFLRILLLTAQRRGEVAGMRWSEIDQAERTWTLPSSRTKNKQRHIVPLSRQAWAIIESMPRIAGSDFVFARDRSGFDACKKRLDARMQTVEPWVMHDLRRSCATGLQRLGVRLEVTEAVLNHTSGSRAGIVGIYQRHDWKDEKALALQAWADHVETLITGKPAANVIRLAQGR
jgi:integrase